MERIEACASSPRERGEQTGVMSLPSRGVILPMVLPLLTSNFLFPSWPPADAKLGESLFFVICQRCKSILTTLPGIMVTWMASIPARTDPFPKTQNRWHLPLRGFQGWIGLGFGCPNRVGEVDAAAGCSLSYGAPGGCPPVAHRGCPAERQGAHGCLRFWGASRQEALWTRQR